MRSLEERFWEKVDRQDDADCWPWLGATRRRYGVIGVGRRGEGNVAAHRFAYELLVGPIPEAMTIDHRCEQSLCVNPAHMEIATRGENMLRGDAASAQNARKMQCKNGHPFTDENTYRRPDGRRNCRRCVREQRRRERAAR